MRFLFGRIALSLLAWFRAPIAGGGRRRRPYRLRVGDHDSAMAERTVPQAPALCPAGSHGCTGQSSGLGCCAGPAPGPSSEMPYELELIRRYGAGHGSRLRGRWRRGTGFLQFVGPACLSISAVRSGNGSIGFSRGLLNPASTVTVSLRLWSCRHGGTQTAMIASVSWHRTVPRIGSTT